MKQHLSNKQTIDIYYNSITNKKCFKDLTLDRESQFYYKEIIKNWKNTRNKNLLNKPLEIFTKGWLIPFNKHLANLMNKTVYLTELVVKWRENKINEPPNDFHLLTDRDLCFLKSLPEAIRLNYDNDPYLAFEMKEYFVNGLSLMLDFLERRCFFDIRQTPIFYKINNFHKEIENSINNESVKLFVENKKTNNDDAKGTGDLNNPFPHIFIKTETYNNFKTYKERHIIDRYTDYSYLFQRMKFKKLLHYTKHIDFMNWLYEENFISKNALNEFTEHNNFKSLDKSYSVQRENNFNKIFNL